MITIPSHCPLCQKPITLGMYRPQDSYSCNTLIAQGGDDGYDILHYFVSIYDKANKETLEGEAYRVGWGEKNYYAEYNISSEMTTIFDSYKNSNILTKVPGLLLLNPNFSEYIQNILILQ